MKIGLYSITYLGCWYRGEALTLPELIRTAKKFGYDGVEIDGKRPHGNPLDWRAAKGSKFTAWPPTTISATPFPKCAKLRSATCAS
jgi:hypothetical protein